MFLISNFRHLLEVVLFLLGDSPASGSGAWESPKRKDVTQIDVLRPVLILLTCVPIK
jgi:hypothetical protein